VRRGFSLLELSVSLAIAGIVVAAAASTGVVVTRILKLDGKKSTADQDSRRLVDFVLGNLQSVGGGQVRPWMAMWHEQGGAVAGGGCPARNGLPPCGTSDRITLVDVDPARAGCTIVSVASDGLSVQFSRPGGGSNPCCYAWNGTPTDPSLPDQYDGQPLMFVSGRSNWALRVATSELNASSCQYGLAPAAVSHFSNWTPVTGAPAGSFPVPASDFVTVFGTGSENTATPVRPRTLYVQPETDATSTRLPRLVEWFDANGNATMDPTLNEVRLVFPGVMNFQLALGYDSNPDNGRVLDTRSTTDEFFGNVTSDSATGLITTGLRMAEVGVITGTRAVEPGARTLQVLDGPTVNNPSLILRRAVGKALLRNVAVFY
jgi:prepilin-type N-terminal cleavage/methylation domain-containing protein